MDKTYETKGGRREQLLQEINFLWNAMHSRVKLSESYADVTICERWYEFENFLDDIINIPGFQEWVSYRMDKTNVEYCFDKDYLHYLETGETHGTMYSPDCCCFIPKDLNLELSRLHKHYPFIGMLKDEQGNIVDVVQFNSLKEARRQGWDSVTISKCLKGKCKTHKGYTWHLVHHCRLPQQLELGSLTKEEYHDWVTAIDGE